MGSFEIEITVSTRKAQIKYWAKADKSHWTNTMTYPPVATVDNEWKSEVVIQILNWDV